MSSNYFGGLRFVERSRYRLSVVNEDGTGSRNYQCVVLVLGDKGNRCPIGKESKVDVNIEVV